MSSTADASRAEFESAGFLVLKGALRQEVVHAIGAMLEVEYARHKAVFKEKTGHSLDDHGYLTALASDASVFGSLPSELKHLVRGELPLEVRLDERLKAVAHEEGLTRVLSILLNAPALRMHNPPSIRVSAPGLSIGNVPLHQDYSYNLHVSDFITAWVPFCRIDDACGGVDVMVGSHREGPLDHEAGIVWGNAVKTGQVKGTYERRHILIGPGDALLFGPLLLHASHANTSARVRTSIDYRFFSSATPTAKHYYDVAARRVIAPPTTKGD